MLPFCSGTAMVRSSNAVSVSIAAPGSSASRTYVVKRGDVLGTIARRNGTTVARLKALNGLKSDRIRIGQRLRVR